MTLTHVDTSTGVRVDAKALGVLGRKYGVLTVLDGVCSVAGEELRQQEWGIDVALTAPYYPEGVTGPELLPKVKAAGAILAGGLHPKIKDRYFRIGHMGATKPGDLLATIGALEAGLHACGYPFDSGVGVAAVQRVLLA